MVDQELITIDKRVITLLLLCLLIMGFVLGFAISGRMVQSNWERFHEQTKAHYEEHCVCRESIPSLQRPTDEWKNQIWPIQEVEE